MATRSTNFNVSSGNSVIREFQMKNLFSGSNQTPNLLQYGIFNQGFQQCYGCPKAGQNSQNNNNVKK